jgi:hypothetical protein
MDVQVRGGGVRYCSRTGVTSYAFTTKDDEAELIENKH